MHETAKLTTTHPLLGQSHATVSIKKVVEVFSTTELANAGIKYRCTNSKCDIPVIAVIVQKLRKDRKKSPASYFRAKNTPHLFGCKPISLKETTSHGSSIQIVEAVNSVQAPAPTRWVDPETASVRNSGSKNDKTMRTISEPTYTIALNNKSSGTSESSSELIEKFAKEWLVLNASEQKLKSLKATWNSVGTYYAAFYPLMYRESKDVLSEGKKIFVGSVLSAKSTTTGFLVELTERGPALEILNVFFPLKLISGSAGGKSLNTVLVAISRNKAPVTVFALGEFKTGTKKSLFLEVKHPHNVFFKF